jgi:DUF2075 family protein
LIVYSRTKNQFLRDVRSNQIHELIGSELKRTLSKRVGSSEMNSWRNSMQFMSNILADDEIPDDSQISIEYAIPLTSKRIDFIITGQDGAGVDTAVIIELKQWSEVTKTKKDAVVSTRLGGGVVEISHPSYQAWTYAALIQDFNETVRNESIGLFPCAYLHNLDTRESVNDPFYREHVSKAPVFISKDAERLCEFIKKHVRYGDTRDVMYRIEHGKIRPSKALADALVGMLSGNKEFFLIDDQKLVFESALDLALKAERGPKQVLIVRGGPGTGKTVVAINLLVSLIQREITTHYVSKNQAVRDVYAAKLSGCMKAGRIKNLFRGSGQFVAVPADTFGALIIDEAHRLNEKSGLYSNLGENQVKELISATRLSVFFLDEDQRVTFRDIGTAGEICLWAESLGANVTEMTLTSQFRCNGSDGYLAWLDDALQIRETANTLLNSGEYQVRVFDDPCEMRDEIFRFNTADNKARMVAGYCWDWVSKNDESLADISIPGSGFKARWNLQRHGMTWLIEPDSVSEVGCIHTCQGLELDYVAVIIGPDLVVRDGLVCTDAGQRSRHDKSVRGYKKMLREDPEKAKQLGDLIVKNTYRTLMTRGQKGCFIYSSDQETREYFRSRLLIDLESQPDPAQVKFSDSLFKELVGSEVRPYVNSVPLFDLKFAAGGFSLPQEAGGATWVELPDYLQPRPGLFVAKVSGESMNRIIPNGSWCLFRLNPSGSRQGKVVVVESNEYGDPEFGGRFTIKRYFSEKVSTQEGWYHEQVILRPESTDSSFETIVIDAQNPSEFRVVAEFLTVL